MLAAVAALLAGCAAPPKPLPHYVAPASGPTAKLVLRGTVSAGDGYGVYIYDDAEKCTGLRSMGTGSAERHPPTVTLPANRITTVEFFLVKPNKNFCGVQWTFTPLAGKTYLLSGNAVEQGCAARVLDMSDPDNIKPELAALRRNPGTNHCLPLSQSRAASSTDADASMTGSEAVLRPSATADDLKGLIGH